MRTTLGLSLLAASLTPAEAFLPAFGKNVARISLTRIQPLYALGEGDYDLLKGAKGGPAKDEYDLLGRKVQADVPILKEDPNDVLLAELIFTTENVREVIFKRLDDCNEQFIAFLEERCKVSTDLDERQAFRSLIEVIDAVKKAVERKKAEEAAMLEEERKKMLEEEAKLMAEMMEAKKQAQTKEQEERQRLSQRDEMQRLQGISASSNEGGDGTIKVIDPQQSYEQLLEAFLGLDYSDQSYVRQVVEANYERCTVEFLDLLGTCLISPDLTEDVKLKLVTLKGHIEAILQDRMAKAASRLHGVVKAGPVESMIEKIYELNEKGEIDEPLILLLESNVQQAERAGAAPAAEVFKKLVATAREAIDESLTPVRRLIRRLLRVEDADRRKELLHEAFRPKATALTADGAKTEAQPDVPPPEFIDELRHLIKNFGNIDTNNFGELLRLISQEAEEVATAIYGKAMTQREQQEYMWQKGSISVFDLEDLESKAGQHGDQMPWQNDKYDPMLPPGFAPDGTRTIGGNRKDQF